MKRRIVPELIRWGNRLRASIFRPTPEREVEEELDFHLAMRVRELRARGMDDDEARRRARAALGDVERLRRDMERLAAEREARMTRMGWWEDLVRDVGLALRQLRRNPGFAAAAVLTLALGIGANTAVFSVVHGVLLKPLPFEEPEELVSLWTRYLPSTGVDIPQFPLSPPEFFEYRDATEALERVAPYTTVRGTLDPGDGRPEHARVLLAGRNLTATLGIRPALGRDFSPEEHDPSAASVLLLSHRYWADRFGADPEAVGRSVTVDGRIARIVGVLPEGVDFPGASVDVWTPLKLDEANPGSRGAHWILGVGRLAEGTTLAGAEAELDGITTAWNGEWEHHASGHFIFLRPLREDLVGRSQPALLALLAAVAMVLVIACVNVANLFLVRRESRQQELAVRTALGAGRGRLVRLILTEALVVCAAGAALGAALAALGTPAVLELAAGAVPRREEVELGLPVLLFTGSVAVATTLVVGLVPALRARPKNPSTRSTSPGRRVGRGRRLLVAGQVALCLVVLLAAGLVVRSFGALAGVEAGVVTEDVVAVGLSLPGDRYDAAEVAPAYRTLLERVEELPGVEEAGTVSELPLTASNLRSDFRVEGVEAPPPGVPAWNAQIRVFGAGYFESMGIPVLEGRPPSGDERAEDPLVVWVDRALAERFWPGESVVGRRVSFASDDGGAPTWLTVAGVVGSVRGALEEPAEPHAYFPHLQLPRAGLGTGRNMYLTVRGSVPAGSLVPTLRAAIRDFDPALPLDDVRTMDEIRTLAAGRTRLAASLMGGFAVLALLLAALGVYGVVSYSVARRTREVGIRAALGAERGSVVRLMLAEGTGPALVGAGVGLVLAALLAPSLETLLFRVPPRDPGTFAVLSATLLGVALAAAWLPARRATRIAPSEALRTE